MSDWDFLHDMHNDGYSPDQIADAAACGYNPWEQQPIDEKKSPARHSQPIPELVIVQDSNDRSVDVPKNWKTTDRKETENSNKDQRKLRTNYVLIDLENVQPKNLDLLKGHDFKVMVFVGANQTKLPFDLASALQAFGEKAKYIKIDGNGQNALDFHIAYYIGELCTKEPNSYFHIISKDTGFDPLINHLKSRKIFVQRSRDLSEIPLLKISSTKSIEEKILAIVENLLSRGSSRPRKVTTLTNSVNSLFMKSLEDSELTNIIKALEERKYIVVTQQGAVTYHLPSNSPNKENNQPTKGQHLLWVDYLQRYVLREPIMPIRKVIIKNLPK